MFGNNNNSQYGYQAQQQYGGAYPQQQPQAQAPAKLESLDELLSGSGAKSFFNADSQPGSSVTGTLELIETSQMRDFQTRQPAYWNDGKPQMQIHLVIQTTLRDPSVDDDDGRRSLWVKGWGVQLKAFRDACRQAGIQKPVRGDTVTATYTGLGERGNAPQPPKLYEYAFQHRTGVDALVNPTQPRQPATQQMGQYQSQQPQAFQQPQQAPQAAPYRQPQAGQYQPQQPQTFQQPQQQTQAASYRQPMQPQQQAVPTQQILQLKAIGKPPQEIAGLLGITVEQVTHVTDAASPQMHAGSEDEPEF